MSQTFVSWFALSEADKLLCFDAKSGARRQLQYQGQKLGAWTVAGKLGEEWNRVLVEVKARTQTVNFQRTISPNKPNNAIVRWVLYLVGKAPETGKLKPMIIAESADIEIAKRACKALQEMKKHSLAPLLGPYEMHYAQVQIRLRAGPASVVPPSSSGAEDHSSLCGRQVVISSRFETEAPTFTTSTVGGAVAIGRTYYALTAAHAFPERTPNPQTHTDRAHTGTGTRSQDQTDASLEDNPSVSHSATAPAGMRYSVYVQKCDRDLINPENLSIPDDPWPISPQASLINSLSHRVIFNRSQDWALVPIENYRFLHENRFISTDGSTARVTGITESIPPGPVVIATGVSDPALSSISETTSLLLLPGCEQPQIVWSARKRSAPGDCGSWVIDQNRKACAMVIAASEDDDEIYCLPLGPIFRDIQKQIRSDKQPELPFDSELLASADQDSSATGLQKSQSHPVNGLGSPTGRISNGSTSGPAPIPQRSSSNDGVLTDTESLHSTTDLFEVPGPDPKSTTLGRRKKKVASTKNPPANRPAADNEIGNPKEGLESFASHDSPAENSKTNVASGESSEGIVIDQKSQDKKAATATVSFQSTTHLPRSPPLKPAPPPGPQPVSSPVLKPERPYVDDPQDTDDVRRREDHPRNGGRLREVRYVDHPDYSREDYRNTAAGPIVLRAREQEEIVRDFPPRPRRRSPSPDSGPKIEREEIIIHRASRESTPRPPPFRERGHGLIIPRPQSPPYPPRPEEIIIRRDDDSRRSRYDDSSREPILNRPPSPSSPPFPPRQKEIIIRRDDDSRRSRYDDSSREEIVIRRDDDGHRSRYDDSSREEIIIRRDDDSRRPRYDDSSREPIIERRDDDKERFNDSRTARYERGTTRGTSDRDEIVIRRRERSEERVHPGRQKQLPERPYRDADHIEIPRSAYRSAYLPGGSRRAFQSLDHTTIVSRREVAPQILDESGIQWDWDSFDDYYIRMTSVSDHQMRQLREKTRRLFDGDYVAKSTSHSLPALADTYTSRRNTDRPPKVRTEEVRIRDPEGMFTGRNSQVNRAIREVEDRYRKQVEKQNSLDSDCRILDLEFEARVQNLFWDAGLSPETCDILVKMHQDKEEKIKAHNLERMPPSTKTIRGEAKAEEGNQDKALLRTCSRKNEIDGVLIPCGESFAEELALRNHENDHLSWAPYHSDAIVTATKNPPGIQPYTLRDEDTSRESNELKQPQPQPQNYTASNGYRVRGDAPSKKVREGKQSSEGGCSVVKRYVVRGENDGVDSPKTTFSDPGDL